MKKNTIIVTGANRGIGRAIVSALAKMPEQKETSIVMACRDAAFSAEAHRMVRDETGHPDIRLMALDLSSFRSIKAFAEELGIMNAEISVLINNAGVLTDSRRETADGFEMTMGVNYIGPYLLTRLLYPMMRRGTGRIINMTSVMYLLGSAGPGIFRVSKEKFRRFKAYSDSKLAFMLFTLEMAERAAGDGITVNSADPGIVSTNMIRMNAWFDPIADFLFRPLIKNADRGARTSVYLATDSGVGGITGGNFINRKERRIPERIIRHPYRKGLWRDTERVLGLEAF